MSSNVLNGKESRPAPSTAMEDGLHEGEGLSVQAPAFQLMASSAAAPPADGNGASKNGKSNGLPGDLLNGFASSTGQDLSNVNVHHNSPEPAKVGALAYAQGNDIHLGAGQEQHLAHEAAHVVQQRQGKVQANTSIGGKPVNDSQALESEADEMGARAMQMKSAAATGTIGGDSTSGAIQRMPMQLRNSAAFVPAAIDRILGASGLIMETDAEDAHPSFWTSGPLALPAEYHSMIWNFHKAAHWEPSFGRTAAEWAGFALQDLNANREAIETAVLVPGAFDSAPEYASPMIDMGRYISAITDQLAQITGAPLRAPSASAAPPVPVTTLGDFPSAETIASSWGEFTEREGSDHRLFIDMPAISSGLGWNAGTMRPLYTIANEGKVALVDAPYAAWQANPADPALEQAYQAALTAFETQYGQRVRQGFVAIWESRRAADPAQALTAATAIESIGTNFSSLNQLLFPDGLVPEEIRWNSITAEGWAQLAQNRSRGSWFDGQDQTFDTRGERNRIASGLGLEHLSENAEEEHEELLEELSSAISQAKRAATPARLNARQTATLATKIAAVIAKAAEVAAYYRAIQDDLARQRAAIQPAINRLNDPVALPILRDVTRRSSRVTHHGHRMSFSTHANNPFAAYSEGFTQSDGISDAPAPRARGRVAPTPAPTPAPLPAATEAPSTPALSATAQRTLNAYNRMIELGVAESPARMIAAASGGEGDFTSTQAIDHSRFSWGFIQFTGTSLVNLLIDIRRERPAIFRRYFENYGITVLSASEMRNHSYGPSTISNRSDREIYGADVGRPVERAPVRELVVFDHDTGEWVNGHEALDVIQRNPRYQMLFAEASADEVDVQVLQMQAAVSRYHNPMWERNWTFGTRPNQVTLQSSEFIENEVAMFALVSRKIGGNIGAVTRSITNYVNRSGIAPTEIAAQKTNAEFQSGMAAAVRRDCPQPTVRWVRSEFLVTAGLPALRDTVYND